MTESSLAVTFNPNGCTVNTGRWTDRWGGYTSTLAADLEIDHTVPFADAWRSGAWAWTDSQRLAFADDLDELNALQGSLNTSKSDKTPDQWKPPLVASWCRYAMSSVQIKYDWTLTVTKAEYNALAAMISSC